MTNQKWDETVDLLIVGSGAGSICASLIAKDHGLSSLILEKLDKFGGATGFSGGIAWIPNNPVMAREGVADSYEQAREYMDAAIWYEGPGTTPERRDAYLRSGPEAITYLEQKGMKFARPEGYADYYEHLPGGHARSRSLMAELFDINELGKWTQHLSLYKGMALHMSLDELQHIILLKRTWKGKLTAVKVALRVLFQSLTGKDYRGAGAAWQGRLLQIALREKLVFRLDTPVKELIVEGDRVVGVLATSNGKTQRIRARRGVLINAGGYSRNAKLRETYGPQPSSDLWTSCPPGDTGDLLQTAMALGAATDCLGESWWCPTSLDPQGKHPEGAYAKDGTPVPFIHHQDICLPHVILVDQHGERFANEAGSYMELGQQLYKRREETGGRGFAWAIIESRHRNRYAWGPVLGRSPQSWFDTGYMKKADTIEELAQKCGIDPAALRKTTERFNGFASSGVDADYGRGGNAFDRFHGDPTVRPNPNLGAIEKPPFYAVAIYPGDVGSAGGLVTDVDGRVLKEDGSAIEGLYATGNSTATVMGRTYPGAGGTIGPALVFGYRAAKHMVRAHEPTETVKHDEVSEQRPLQTSTMT